MNENEPEITLGLISSWIDLALEYGAGDDDDASKLIEYCGDYFSPYYGVFRFAAFAMEHLGIAVELGVHTARGSMSLSLGGIKVIGIDHTKQFGDLEIANFEFLEQDSLPVPERIKTEKISVLHIDTEHSYSQAKAEFEAYQPYLSSPAIVFFDDLHAQNDGVMKYFITLPYPKIIDDRLHPSCGFGILLYE